MPFTVSHVLAVLPLATGRPGRKLWPAALVIGSMIPDLPYFVPPHRGSSWSHAASGPFTIDLALGLAVFAVWHLVMRGPLVDLAPRWLANRLPPPRTLRPRDWTLVGLSVVLGASTHVVWDTFTHPGRWGTDHLTVLNGAVGPLPAYKWLQFGSGVLGLLALAVWVLTWLRRRPARPTSTRLSGDLRVRVWVWAIMGTAVLGAVVGYWGPAVVAGRAFAETVAVRVATGTISVTGAALLTLCVVWQAGRWLGSDNGIFGERPADGGHG